MPQDFLTQYLRYTSDTEATATFHRWSAIVGIGAWMEKDIWMQFGAGQDYANQYVMLLGESGSRKSAAIKGFVRILKLAGYKTIAAEKTSKEKFFTDLAAQHQAEEDEDSLLWGDVDKSAVTPILIAADEANDFFGLNNLEFLSTLGSLWDHEGSYEIKYKTTKSDVIPNPNINILAGNTPSNFALAFPPTIIGQGFFSRILLIHGEKTRAKIAWPKSPDPEHTAYIVGMLGEMKSRIRGQIDPTPTARALMGQIYEQPDNIRDQRFTSYYNRRYTHLRKLCLVIAASKLEKEITESTVIQANTYLTYIQNLMPKALGEYGKNQDSGLTHSILSFIASSNRGVSLKEITKQVQNDVKNARDVQVVLEKLIMSDKVQATKAGFLPIRSSILEDGEGSGEDKFVDFHSYLTAEELGVKTS